MKTFFHCLAVTFLVGLLATAFAFAGDAAGLPVLDQIHGVLGGMSDAVIGVIAMVVEAIFRMVPSKKPLSLCWVGVRALDYIIVVLQQLQQDLKDLATLANRLLPADPAAAPVPAQPASPQGA